MNTTCRVMRVALLLLSLPVSVYQTPTVLGQTTVVTYQGRILDSGTNFTGAGQFKFALVTSTNNNHTATATANLSGSSVTSYTVTSGGNGYTAAPAVHVTGGGGSGATATANISGGVVTSLTPGSAGSGYTSAPGVTIDPPPPNIAFTTYWSNDGTSANGSEPATAVSVNVSNGLFTVALGDTSVPNMLSMNASLFNRAALQLRIWFSDQSSGFAALAPTQNLTPSPYAAFAITASNLVNGLSIQPNTNGAPNVIGGSPANFVGNGIVGATVGGGGATNYSGTRFTNSVTADFGTVGGGAGNTVSGPYSTVSGGEGNVASGQYATVGGGIGNTASGYASFAAGVGNNASGAYSFAAGGGNTASGAYGVALGSGSSAIHNGSFVWSDSGTSPGISSITPYEFAVRASGGIRFVGNVQLDTSAYRYLSLNGGNSLGYLYGSFPWFGDGIHLGYNFYSGDSGVSGIPNPGGATSRVSVGYGYVGIYVGTVNNYPTTQRLLADTTHIEVNGTFNNNSDRNAKRDFAPISSSQLLEKVARLPISEWSYKDDPTTRHVGPMAQDFYSVFSLGTDDKHIAPIDEGGVALAAIQGLDKKLEIKSHQLEAENAELKARNASLEKRLDRLEELLQAETGGVEK